MSDLMFNEAPNVDGTKYAFGDWKRYAQHDHTNIRGFFGDYRFLSNFYPCEVWFEGLKYPSTETAYQSAKVIPELREPFTTMTDIQSKKAWKIVGEEGILPNWDKRKFAIMEEVVFQKFLRNLELREKLIATAPKYLEETNWWKDAYWGYCIHSKSGQNNLGKILMATRSYFRSPHICETNH